MSQYDALVVDFPDRASKLWPTFRAAGAVSRQEVTTFLMVASAAVAIPFERLSRSQHPAGDAARYLEAKAAFDTLMKERFLGSALWPSSSGEPWCYGKLKSVDGNPGSWEELWEPRELGPDTKTETIVRHVRNALAHGNVFTFGDPITRIALLSQVDPEVYKFKYLVAALPHYEALLENWFAFLQACKCMLPFLPVPESETLPWPLGFSTAQPGNAADGR
jgi:hypothetical protein